MCRAEPLGRCRRGTPTSALRLSFAAFAATLISVAAACVAEEPSAEAVLHATAIRRGLVVHVGARDGSLAEALVRAEPVLVYAVAADAATEARLRQRFVQAGVHGQATAGSLAADGALPLADEVAAMVVADLDAARELKREELLRVVRPLGRAYLRQGGQWQVVTKPRPADVDDWRRSPRGF